MAKLFMTFRISMVEYSSSRDISPYRTSGQYETDTVKKQNLYFIEIYKKTPAIETICSEVLDPQG